MCTPVSILRTFQVVYVNWWLCEVVLHSGALLKIVWMRAKKSLMVMGLRKSIVISWHHRHIGPARKASENEDITFQASLGLHKMTSLSLRSHLLDLLSFWWRGLSSSLSTQRYPLQQAPEDSFSHHQVFMLPAELHWPTKIKKHVVFLIAVAIACERRDSFSDFQWEKYSLVSVVSC